MARQQRFQRKIDKNGKVYYNELKKDSRGITRYVRTSDKKGAKAFVDKNYKVLKNNYTKLTKKETTSIKRSKAQKSLYRWNGVPIKKEITDFFLKDGIINEKSPKDLSKANLPNLKRPSDLEREFKFLINRDNKLDSKSEWGGAGFRGRIKAENIVSIKEELQKWLNQGFVLNVKKLKKEGKKTKLVEEQGVKAWSSIKNFETETFDSYREKDTNTAFVKFDYKVEIDSNTKKINIDLRKAKSDPMYSDPISSPPFKKTNIKKERKK
jgi:hypothetical protein